MTPFVAHLWAFVRWTVVDQNDFIVGKGLADYTLNAAVERAFHLIDRDDNAQFHAAKLRKFSLFRGLLPFVFYARYYSMQVNSFVKLQDAIDNAENGSCTHNGIFLKVRGNEWAQ